MKRITLMILVAILAAMAVASAAYAHPGHEYSNGANAESTKKLDAKTKKKLAGVRGTTARYQNADKAIEDGYVATETCVASSDGGMGFRCVNPGLASDAEVDLKKPEMLLYAPKKNRK